jgi:hypothetical protein
MKILKRIFITLLLILALFSVFAIVSGKIFLFKAVWHNFADIDDYKIFTNNTVSNANAQPWNVAVDYNKQVLPDNLKSLLETLGMAIMTRLTLVLSPWQKALPVY